MPVPIVYRAGGDPTVSFSWAEFASNIGYVTFRGGKALNQAGTGTYFLTTGTPKTEQATSFFSDIDFDFTFGKAMNMLIAPIITCGTINVNNGATGGVSVKIYHYDGTTETQIGSTYQCPNEANAGVNNRLYRFCAYTLPTAKQVFKVGDILRLNLTENGNVSALYHDPSNSSIAGPDDNESCTAGLTCNVPFNIQG